MHLSTIIITTIAVFLNSLVFGTVIPQEKQEACKDVSVQIVILTMDRPSGLKTLLASLQNSDYGCSVLNLHFSIDLSNNIEQNDITTNICKAFTWKYGAKTISRRVRNAGLRNNWFESIYWTDTSYIAIFEDDMDVSVHWYTFLNTVHSLNLLSPSNISNLCLHPIGNRRQLDCTSAGSSRFFMQSRFVCSWGPVWKSASWMMMVDHSMSLLRNGTKPYIPENVEDGRMMNKWTNLGYDVQSVYVKRFLLDTHKFTLTYSLTACVEKNYNINGSFFGINTKLKGLHYPRRSRFQSGKELLVENMKTITHQLFEINNTVYSDLGTNNNMQHGSIFANKISKYKT